MSPASRGTAASRVATTVAVGAALMALALVACGGSSDKPEISEDNKKGTPLDDDAVHKAIKDHKKTGSDHSTQVGKMLAVGAKAPEFTADANTGPVKLSDYLGKKVVLYFYPKDFTGG